MNVGTGTEGAQFLFREYLNLIFGKGHMWPRKKKDIEYNAILLHIRPPPPAFGIILAPPPSPCISHLTYSENNRLSSFQIHQLQRQKKLQNLLPIERVYIVHVHKFISYIQMKVNDFKFYITVKKVYTWQHR